MGKRASHGPEGQESGTAGQTTLSQDEFGDKAVTLTPTDEKGSPAALRKQGMWEQQA